MLKYLGIRNWHNVCIPKVLDEPDNESLVLWNDG
jgi:hypothetical protein